MPVSPQLTEANERLLRHIQQQQEQQEQQPQRQERGEEDPEGLRGLHVRFSAAAEGSAVVCAPAGGSTLALAMVVREREGLMCHASPGMRWAMHTSMCVHACTRVWFGHVGHGMWAFLGRYLPCAVLGTTQTSVKGCAPCHNDAGRAPPGALRVGAAEVSSSVGDAAGGS